MFCRYASGLVGMVVDCWLRNLLSFAASAICAIWEIDYMAHLDKKPERFITLQKAVKTKEFLYIRVLK